MGVVDDDEWLIMRLGINHFHAPWNLLRLFNGGDDCIHVIAKLNGSNNGDGSVLNVHFTKNRHCNIMPCAIRIHQRKDRATDRTVGVSIFNVPLGFVRAQRGNGCHRYFSFAGKTLAPLVIDAYNTAS